MATVLETLKRKALRGVIREIENNGTMSLVRAEINDKDMSVASEISKKELDALNLQIGDTVDIFPFGFNTYIIVSESKQYKTN